jgi:NADPH-dependent ferric siderophore reductase
MASTATAIRGWVGRTFFRELTITQVRDVGRRFRRLTVRASNGSPIPFDPGDKLQIMVPESGPRTYTPFGFDAVRDTFDLLVHEHRGTPGTSWSRLASRDDRIHVLGPRSSLALGSLEGPVVLFGDETSFAVARALEERRGRVGALTSVFEVSDRDDSTVALDDLGLADRVLMERTTGAAHLDEIEARIRASLVEHPGAHLVMSGSAQSIQSLRASLRARPVPRAGDKVKAYWSLGKRGLD